MITGLHHVTAIASDAKRNLEFYTRFLGLRLVKKTVNFDDPKTYHLYYGDQNGSPGSILTFFPWPRTLRGRAGSGQTTVTSYAVPRDSLDYWISRAQSQGVAVSGIAERFGEPFITLRDPDNTAIELVATAAAGGTGLQAFHGVTLTQWNLAPTAKLLTDLLNFTVTGEERNRTRFHTGGAGFVDVEVVPDQRRGSIGAGTVHHIAFRTPTEETHREWRQRISEAGVSVSPIMDRNYFHSLYFREPGGVLFELAHGSAGVYG